MRRSTGGEPELVPHPAIEPGAGLGGARPHPLVEAAEQQEVGRLQARLELAPDQQPRVARRARPHRARRHRLGEQRRIGRRHDQVIGIARLEQLGAEGGAPPRPPRATTAPRPSPARRARAPRRSARCAAHQLRQGDLGEADELWNGSASARSRRPSAPAGRAAPARASSSASARAWPSSARMPAKPPLRRGPRRQARSSARARWRNAPRSSPRRAERMLEHASRATGLTPSTIRRAHEQQKTAGRGLVERRAGGIVDLDLPAAQLDRDAAGEVAVGRDQRRGAARRLERRAHAQRQRQRLARQIGMLLDRQALRSPPAAAARSRCQAPTVALGRIASDRSRARAGSLPATPGAGQQRDLGALDAERLQQLLQAILRMARLEQPPARLVEVLVEARAARPCRAAGRRSPRSSARVAGMLPVEPGGDDPRSAGGAARQRPASAVSSRWRRSAGSSACSSASTRGPGLGDHRQHLAAHLPVLGQRVRHQAIERGERHPLGLQLVEQRRELAGEPQAVLERPVERREQAREQQLPAQARRSPAAAPARGCRRAAARRPRSRRSAGSAAAAAAGPPARRRNASPRLRQARRVGSRTSTSASASAIVARLGQQAGGERVDERQPGGNGGDAPYACLPQVAAQALPRSAAGGARTRRAAAPAPDGAGRAREMRPHARQQARDTAACRRAAARRVNSPRILALRWAPSTA